MADTPSSPPISARKHFSADDISAVNLKLQKVKTNWFACSMNLKQVSEDVMRFRTNLDKQHIVHKIKVILGNNSESEEKEEPKVPFELAQSVYQKKQIQVYRQAIERLSQQLTDFQRHRNSIIQHQYHFEKFHGVLQMKMKFMENLTPEMFCNCEEIERSKILEESLLSAGQCYMEKKCGELYDEVIRNNNMLRITYGFPEKSEQEDIDEIEKKFSNYKRLCDRLRYSIY